MSSQLRYVLAFTHCIYLEKIDALELAIHLWKDNCFSESYNKLFLIVSTA